MKTVITDSRGIKYQKIDNDTCYHVDTNDSVINNLEAAKSSQARIRVFYGDTKTGLDWNEEHDVLGYIGQSTGNIKIPLLVNNSRSLGGPALLDHCIVKIMLGHTVTYQHEKYHSLPFTVKGNEVYRDNKKIARFKTSKQAENYKLFMEGKRNKL